MARPSIPSLAARRAAWDRLWQILLAPPVADAGRVAERRDEGGASTAPDEAA